MVEDHKCRIWNRDTHLRHVVAKDCPSAICPGSGRGRPSIGKRLYLLRFTTSRFGHLLATFIAVGSVGMSLSVTGPKNQGNSGSGIVSGQTANGTAFFRLSRQNVSALQNLSNPAVKDLARVLVPLKCKPSSPPHVRGKTGVFRRENCNNPALKSRLTAI